MELTCCIHSIPCNCSPVIGPRTGSFVFPVRGETIACRCGHCQKLHPKLDQVSQQLQKLDSVVLGVSASISASLSVSLSASAHSLILSVALALSLCLSLPLLIL